MSDTVTEDLVPESVLADLDAERLHAAERAEVARIKAEALAFDATAAEQRVAALAFIREYMAARVGRPWAEVRAEMDTDLKNAEAALFAAQQRLRDAQEHERDLLGHVRVLRQKLEAEAEVTP